MSDTYVADIVVRLWKRRTDENLLTYDQEPDDTIECSGHVMIDKSRNRWPPMILEAKEVQVDVIPDLDALDWEGWMRRSFRVRLRCLAEEWTMISPGTIPIYSATGYVDAMFRGPRAEELDFLPQEEYCYDGWLCEVTVRNWRPASASEGGEDHGQS